MEFHQSSITRPEPLRIIKHSAAHKNSHSSGEISVSGISSTPRVSSAPGIPSSGEDLSPPQISDGRLTIRKRRVIKKPPVFSEHLDSSAKMDSSSQEQDHSRLVDNLRHEVSLREIGPFVRVGDIKISDSLLGVKENNPKPLSLSKDSCLSREQASRDTTTVDNFEVPLASSQNRQGPRNISDFSSESDLGTQHICTNVSRPSTETVMIPSTEMPDELQRRISTSRKLFKRAKNGLGSLRLKSRKPSKEPVSEVHCGSLDIEGPTFLKSTDCSWSVVNRKDASETRSKLESTDSFQPTPISQTAAIPYVLRPEIAIYPEVDSVTSGSDYLVRVAIKITGALKPALPVAQQKSESDLSSLTSVLGNEIQEYGTIHDFDIACFDMLGSPVEYMITPNWPVSIGAHDSYTLILGVRVATTRFRSVSNDHVRTTSDEMIEDLTSHLGLIEFQYLRIKMACQHTAFEFSQETSLPAGCNYQVTQLETEARAVIKVLPPPDSSLSSWGLHRSNVCPDNSTASFVFDDVLRSSFSPLEMYDYMTEMSSWEIPKPVHTTVDTEYDVGTIRRKSMDRSSETVIQSNITSSTSMASFRTARSGFSISPLRLLRSNAPSPHLRDENVRAEFANSTPKVNHSHTRLDDPETPDYNPSEDPASKIWKEMRRTSTGSGRRQSLVSNVDTTVYSSTNSSRNSDSSDSNTSAPSEMSMGMILPPREHSDISSPESLDRTPRAKRTNTGDFDVDAEDDMFWQEKEMIRKEALRNKRSISADTVHSLAGGSSGQRGIGIRAGFWGLFG